MNPTDFAKDLIVETVTNKGGCSYHILYKCMQMEDFHLRLPEIVDELVIEGRLLRLRFDVPVFGMATFLLPAGSVEVLG